MAKRHVITVDCTLPLDEVEYAHLASRKSLLDADIVLFCLSTPGNRVVSGVKERALEDLIHWRKQLVEALGHGKTIFVFLSSKHALANISMSGAYSGKPSSDHHNYDVLPFEHVSVTNAEGTKMRLAENGGIICEYWKWFEEYSEYLVHFEDQLGDPLVITRSGNRVVGSICKSDSGGAILFLPFLKLLDIWEAEESSFYQHMLERAELTTDAFSRLTRQFYDCILRIDRALHESLSVTQAPIWSYEPEFRLFRENELRKRLEQIERQVERLNLEKDAKKRGLYKAELPRRLLFESGKPLEQAIIQALKTLGFEAKPYRDSDSEFDSVFSSAEGRLIGEAEGKDSKAVNVDKLRQLHMNLDEDSQRREVTEKAKGVLFGNGFRLVHPTKRGELFSQKCVTAAEQGNDALVRTTDLFSIVQYLLAIEDEEFARQCRLKIVESKGLVEFPKIPALKAKGRSRTGKKYQMQGSNLQ